MKKSLRVLMAGIFVLAIGAAGCGSDDPDPTPTSPTPAPTPTPTPTPAPTPAPTSAALSGVVSNTSGERIGGARVTVIDGPNTGTSVDTNSSGDYRFATLAIGNANFSATAAGYREDRRGTTVDGSNTLNFTLSRSAAALTGTVSSSSGARIGGATVTAIDGANSGTSVTANSDGEYRFDSLTVDNVNFRATATGFEEDRRGVFVNGTNTLNFSLTPSAVVPSITITTRIVAGGPGAAAQEWEFTATSNETFVSYDWDFGDGAGANGSGRIERHLYTTRDDYTVTVSGRRSNGTRLTAELDIEVE